MNTLQADSSSSSTESFKPLKFLDWRYRLTLVGLMLAAIGFGVNVEIRGALLHHRRTDVGAYFSAAWSVRIGSDPYFATDRNGWHYLYPPLFAVLLTPFADAPPTMHRYWLIPYAISVAAWYVLSILFMIAASNQLATQLVTLMRRRAGPADLTTATNATWSWRWWMLFFWPILICLPVTFRSVVRGQVGPLWLLLLCSTIVAILSNKPFRAGLILSGAICLKLIPLFLLLYPLWRRRPTMLLGAAVGMVFGLIVIPILSMGRAEFITANQHYFQSIVFPGATGHRIDPAIEHELMDPITSDTQSYVTVLMDIGHMFFHTTKGYTAPLFARIGHLLIATGMVAGTLFAAGWKRRDFDPIGEAIFFAILCVVMLPIAPTCHPHYFMLMIPLILAIIATFIEPGGPQKLSIPWLLLIWAIIPAHLFTSAPAIQTLRDIGLVTWMATALAIAAMVRLYRRRRTAPFALTTQ